VKLVGEERLGRGVICLGETSSGIAGANGRRDLVGIDEPSSLGVFDCDLAEKVTAKKEAAVSPRRP
jgi:hypothetical protein